MSHPTAIPWADPARQAAFEGWLAAVAPAHALDPATLRLASADASFRRYFRIDRTGDPHAASRIVMDAPPALENSEPFVRVASLLRDAGLRVPEVLDWQREHGFLLLSDLGTQTMLDVVDRDTPDANRPLYQQAIDVLVALQKGAAAGGLPAYDAALLRRELQLFPDWYIGRHRGVALDAGQQAVLDKAFEAIVAHNLAAPTVCVHRDFMPRNLMVSGQGLGVLDFQDAVHGPITYDIASLMRDAFLSWDEEFVLDITVRYWQKAQKAGLPVDPDFGEFYRGVEWMGLQRHLKVAGIFARLTLRDGKAKYLADAPRFIGYIRSTCARYRELTPLLRLIDQIEKIETPVGFAYGRMG